MSRGTKWVLHFERDDGKPEIVVYSGKRSEAEEFASKYSNAYNVTLIEIVRLSEWMERKRKKH